MMLDVEACSRAVSSRDPRFDGVFFVGITTTRIYCRPVCPARVSYPERRRFFDSAAAAERNGFRPCLRCRPELAPGRALCDAVPRLARAAALRIAEGALNGRSVEALARELGVGGRQLRRAMERELGVSPVELAQTHRLLLAKCLLTDTALPVTRVAYSSGFQSLRRFNSAFREQYRMSPSALRRADTHGLAVSAPESDGASLVRLTLSYRPPLAWDALLERLDRDATPGIEMVADGRYGRTVSLDGCRGVVFLQHARRGSHVLLDLSVALLPVLMPLIARLRRLGDLDAEPAVIDAHLAATGLGAQISRRPGLRMPVAFDGFEAAVLELVGAGTEALVNLVAAASEPMETGWPGLTRVELDARRVAALGEPGLRVLGVPAGRAEGLVLVARAVADGSLRLEPGVEPQETLRRIRAMRGIVATAATAIVMRALHWPDAFSDDDSRLRRRAERWRPWRAYATEHLRLEGHDREADGADRGPVVTRHRGTG